MPRACPHGLMELKRKEIKDAFEIFEIFNTDNSGSGYWILDNSVESYIISYFLS
jgi:hypothetical protein